MANVQLNRMDLVLKTAWLSTGDVRDQGQPREQTWNVLIIVRIILVKVRNKFICGNGVAKIYPRVNDRRYPASRWVGKIVSVVVFCHIVTSRTYLRL